MRNQIYPYIFILSGLVLGGLLVYYMFQNIKLKPVVSFLSKSIPIRAEVISYYSNGTHIIFYVKFYEKVNASNLIFYINNQKAVINKKGIIKPGETIMVYAPIQKNQEKYTLLGTIKGTYYVLKETVIVTNVTYNYTFV